MARIGKIARLPRSIRCQLNRRLDNGDKGADIVQWLNDLEEVQWALGFSYGGRPVTEQNLSLWRQSGFLDWKRHQDACEWVSQLAGGAHQLADEAGLMPLSDSLASFATLTLGKRLQELGVDPLSDAEKREEFLSLLKELTRMRRDDMKAAQLRMKIQSYEQNHGS
jgi:hypothetical protein